MSYLRIASVTVALTALSGVGSLALGGGVPTPSGGGMGMPPPAPPPIPEITLFTCAVEVNGLWSFWGQVANPTGAEGLTIQFDGIPAINGQSVPVNPDGSFSLTIMIPANQTGVVGATLVDDEGDEYDEAETYVT